MTPDIGKNVLVSPWLAQRMGFGEPPISASDSPELIEEARISGLVPTRVLVVTIPESMHFLRSLVGHLPKARPAGADESGRGSRKGGPRAPCDLDALCAADSLLEELGFWASEMGVSTRDLGPVWRVRGDIRGVMNNSALAAELLCERVLEEMDRPGYAEPQDMHLRLTNQRVKQAEYYPTLRDILADAIQANEPEDDDDW